MRVTVQKGSNKGWGTQYHLMILDGYRAGNLVRDCLGNPTFDIDRERLIRWASETGYEVVIGT